MKAKTENKNETATVNAEFQTLSYKALPSVEMSHIVALGHLVLEKLGVELNTPTDELIVSSAENKAIRQELDALSIENPFIRKIMLVAEISYRIGSPIAYAKTFLDKRVVFSSEKEAEAYRAITGAGAGKIDGMQFQFSE